ncbi:MAG: invasion associated locus B family protein [Dongiaceae bacterium]
MKRIASVLISAALAVTLGASAGLAAERVAQFEKWEVVTFEEDGATGCYIMARPYKEEGSYTERGPAAAFVTHRPSLGEVGVVSIAAGYAYDPASAPRIEIGGESFNLFAQGQNAWAHDDDDPQIVAAMKAGNDMVVVGVSEHGTETRDTYSLSGFTRATVAAAEACGL